MDFSKYLPDYMIVKNVFNICNSTTHRYFITKRKDLNIKAFNHKSIISWHPLIIRDGNNFYYFKSMTKQDFCIATFCLNNEIFDQTYNNSILENYFNKNSFEI